MSIVLVSVQISTKELFCFLLGEKKTMPYVFCASVMGFNSHDVQCHGKRRILLILIFVDRYGAAKGGHYSNYVPAPDGCIPIHLNLVVSYIPNLLFPKNQFG